MITRRAFVMMGFVIVTGCGGGGITAPKTFPVTGTVLVKGKPTAGVRVTFHPKFDMGPVKFAPSGMTDKQGRFTLSTAAPGDGAPPGEYTITFELMRVTADKTGLETEIDIWKGKYADKYPATIKPDNNELEALRLD